MIRWVFILKFKNLEHGHEARPIQNEGRRFPNTTESSNAKAKPRIIGLTGEYA